MKYKVIFVEPIDLLVKSEPVSWLQENMPKRYRFFKVVSRDITSILFDDFADALAFSLVFSDSLQSGIWEFDL